MRQIFLFLLLTIALTANAQRHHLVFESSFEDPTLSEWSGIVRCLPDRVSTSTTIKKTGQRSARFYSLLSDTSACNELRSQLILNDTNAINYERWYGFSFYLGSDYPTNYDGVENFLEFFRTDTVEAYYPLGLSYYGYADGVSVLWPSGNYISATRILQTQPPASNYTIFIDPLKTVASQQWVDIVMKIKWSNDTTGRVRVWVNDVLAFGFNGVTNYGPNNLRIGIDKWDWRLGWYVSSTSERELYIDEFRIGDSLATYNDVRPGASIPLPIHWLIFTATKKTTSVKLYWEAEFGANFEKFIVEKNVGNGWKQIGTVFSNPLNEYSFIDKNPASLNLYRIRALNLGENDSYSDTRVVRFSEIAPLKVSVYNMIGQLVKTGVMQSDNMNSFMKSLNLISGVYIVRYEDGQSEKVFVGN